MFAEEMLPPPQTRCCGLEPTRGGDTRLRLRKRSVCASPNLLYQNLSKMLRHLLKTLFTSQRGGPDTRA